MHVVLSLTLGTGLLLVFLSLTAKRTATVVAPVEPEPSVAARTVTVTRGDVATRVAAAVLALVAVQGFLGWPALSVAAGIVGALLPSWYRGQREARRREAVEDAVAEVVDALRDASRTGVGIEDALRSLARSGPLALRPALRALERDLRLMEFDVALARARESVAHPAFDMLAVALVMSFRVGGRNLSGVLDGLGRSVRGTARARREVRAQQAEQVMSARVIAALPVLLIVVLRAVNPGYLDVFSTPTGQVVLAVCLVLPAVGYTLMRRTITLPGRERVLR
ncbi:MAG: hypothetical protein AMXMBFR23_09870 [Chloroflexota bacterium]